MYCFFCLTYLANGGRVNYSYRNTLNQLLNGNITGLVQLGNLITLVAGTGNHDFTYTDSDNRPMGMDQQCSVDGTYCCGYHVSYLRTGGS